MLTFSTVGVLFFLSCSGVEAIRGTHDGKHHEPFDVSSDSHECECGGDRKVCVAGVGVVEPSRSSVDAPPHESYACGFYPCGD